MTLAADTPSPRINDGRFKLDSLRGAVEWLETQGYKVGRPRFTRDFKAGLVMDDGHGLFFPQRLLEYAEAYLVNKKAKTPDTGDAMTNQLRRVKADADNKEALAARNKLKLEVEQGLLIEKEKHELSLAARAAFLKREVETLGLRLGQDIIALVGGDPSRLDDFIGFWKDKTETWLDTWSKDQEFTVDLDLETLTPGLLTSGRRPIGQRGRPRGAPNKKVGAEDK